jgi:2-C-methyl-D-erythritol 4-phosphate cytidylyltransferase
MKIGAILLMAGSGERFGNPTPKQFLPLLGKPLYTYALQTLRNSHLFDEIILVSHPDYPIPEASIPGGKTRQESSYLGLQAFITPPDIVLIHDAVRPFITLEILQNNIQGAIKHGAIDTCIPSADTLVYAPQNIITDIPLRAHFARGQTPQTFRYADILHAHTQALKAGITNATDDCQLLLRLGHPIHIVAGHETNIKITTEFDLLLAEHILSKCKAAIYSPEDEASLRTPFLQM